MRGLLASVALAALAAACLGEALCPCGEAFDRDPFDPEAELSVPVEHRPSDHCWCRCGAAGLPERMAPALDCAGFEVACERADGQADVYACD
ncbi:MAG: hypothetical protein HS111_01590 [Kofleriaceae bacterium]|nr:hypothetical protein [Kofleriaceae bacterium]MCL4226941.1 hypothetical protein [Myxococcales bacterium]